MTNATEFQQSLEANQFADDLLQRSATYLAESKTHFSTVKTIILMNLGAVAVTFGLKDAILRYAEYTMPVIIFSQALLFVAAGAELYSGAKSRINSWADKWRENKLIKADKQADILAGQIKLAEGPKKASLAADALNDVPAIETIQDSIAIEINRKKRGWQDRVIALRVKRSKLEAAAKGLGLLDEITPLLQEEVAIYINTEFGLGLKGHENNVQSRLYGENGKVLPKVTEEIKNQLFAMEIHENEIHKLAEFGAQYLGIFRTSLKTATGSAKDKQDIGPLMFTGRDASDAFINGAQAISDALQY